MVSHTAEVQKGDVDAARALSAEYLGLSSRDCIHVAVMKRLGPKKIWSYDAGFDAVPALQRIA